MIAWTLPGVEESKELDRILALPRRQEPPIGTEKISEVLALGSDKLRPIQAQALAELYCCRGLLAPISVGEGKTLVTFLAPSMIDSERPLLLIPAKLREKTRREFSALKSNWRSDREIKILSFEKLGRDSGSTLLEDYKPDLIIADECHKLKNVKAAVTRRVGRYFDANPTTIFCGLSGTVTKRSLFDFAHLAEWALKDGAPIPLTRFDLEQWARAIDEENQWIQSRLAPGALEKLGAPLREAYQRRLVETPGVVASSRDSIGTGLVISEWKYPVKSRGIRDALKNLRDTWETPNGEALVTAVDVWRHAREIAQGFCYRWDPPPPEAWLEARRAWASFARNVLSHSTTLDTEFQVRKKHANHPLFRTWLEIKASYNYQVIPEWITTEVLEASIEWAQEDPGIVWVDNKAIGEKLDELGLPYYGAKGQRKGKAIEDARGSVAASIAANCEGRNLQFFARNLILSPPTTGDRWEQLIGRTHRQGQKADEVSVEIFFGCEESRGGFLQALSDSRYQKGISGSPQKLLVATIAFEP